MAAGQQTIRDNMLEEGALASASRATAQHRTSRLFSAWITSIPSKGVTLFVQIIAIPTVYRAVGPAQFAAYAAVTSVVTVLSFLNIGMGGALVTPLAQAAADHDHEREANLLFTTLIPIGAIAGIALCITLPLLLLLPLKLLFGLAAATIPPQALRTAAVLACIGTLVAVPLSVTDNVRQAYQEMHIINLIGIAYNVVFGAGLLLTAWLSPTLPAFVGVMVFTPLLFRIVNGALLARARPYLLNLPAGWGSWALMRRLARDGLSYMSAASIVNILLYQWPIYYMARVRPAQESSLFAVYLQLILLALSFGASFALPLWSAMADAKARADNRWIVESVRRAQQASLGFGACIPLAFGLGMNVLLRLWLHRPIHITSIACWLAGAYFLLALWEQVHWPIVLGLGKIRVASNLVFLRVILFAPFVPLAVRYGQSGVMALLCASGALTTAWGYPRIMSRALEDVGVSARRTAV